MATNLDLICAKYGSELAGVEEKVLNKAIDVLREDGVYTLFLYLDAEGQSDIRGKCLELLRDPDTFNDMLPANCDLATLRARFTGQHEKLLLTKELLEKMLAYARHHTKLGAA